MFKLIALILSGFAALMLLVLAQPLRHTEPDPDLLRLAVRATVHAWPTPEPREVVVTRVVEVTRIVEVTRVVEAAHETLTPTPPETSEPTPPAEEPAFTPTSVPPTPVSNATIDEPVMAAARQVEPAEVSLEPEPPVMEVEAMLEEVGVLGEEVVDEPAPVVKQATASGCPATSDRYYTTVPIEGGPINHPDREHGDLNLALRGSQAIEGHLGLVDISGPTDGAAPQLDGIFSDRRLPAFVGLHRVNDWNWGCGGRGCRGEPLGHPEATLAVVGASPGEPLASAQRGAEIYGGGFVALVLFADGQSVTLGYTREDSVANGYAVHLGGICVDPNLLHTYRDANAQGRGALPALRNGETLGTAAGATLHLAVRDRGVFKDPRSRKDWWARH